MKRPTPAQRKIEYERNKGAYLKRALRWRADNPDKVRIANQRYTKSMAYTLTGLKHRAKKRGIAFDLTTEYLETIWTGTCPVFSVKIKRQAGVGGKNTASLDRIDNSKGYVVGNVVWVSCLANRIKSNATVEEIRQVFEYYRSCAI